MTAISNPRPELVRDRYGRPLVTPPNGGKPVPYTRCTTFVDVIEDKFALQKWSQRMVALGLAARPDLLLSVSAHRDDKGTLDKVCADAREAASASAAATTGTALHALSEVVDRGEDLPVLPEQTTADLAAYKAATVDLSAVAIEQFCVLDNLQIGGTPDRIVEYNGQLYIADLKTGSIDFGTLKIAAQLAVYARSQAYDIATGSRTPHGADLTRGIIIHVPAGTGTATLHWVDLEAGWAAVQVAKQVREQRKHKFKDLTEPFGPVIKKEPEVLPEWGGIKFQGQSLEARIRGCATADDVRALWAANQDDWSDELTKTAMTHIASLAVAS